MIEINTDEHGKSYTIVQDDNDGNHKERNQMSLYLRSDGDVFIGTQTTLRFREPWNGGGMYPKTYQKLRELLRAIEEDKDDIENGRRGDDVVKETGGIDQYFKDLEDYEEQLYCSNGCSDFPFRFRRTVSNGDVYHCEACGKEQIVGHRPNEDNY